MGIISFVCKLGVMAYATPQRHQTRHKTIPRQTNTNLPNGRVGLAVNLPGLTKNDLTLAATDESKVILLQGVKPANENTGEQARSFAIRIVLPDASDMKDVHAKIDNGVLLIDVAKNAFVGTRINIE
ncbi:hypothetical protein HDU98_006059 [Podochytrium sp. JEL0797]|nr:hypothetical protein HDU98_006059 [Podochytrium sp. JEL0797]